MSVRRSLTVVCFVALCAGIVMIWWQSNLIAREPFSAIQQASGNVPQYTVVQTDGLHLIVTDNTSNTTYFYAIDEGEKPGADLKLRGSVDLKQIGQPVIKPTLVKRN